MIASGKNDTVNKIYLRNFHQRIHSVYFLHHFPFKQIGPTKCDHYSRKLEKTEATFFVITIFHYA